MSRRGFLWLPVTIFSCKGSKLPDIVTDVREMQWPACSIGPRGWPPVHLHLRDRQIFDRVLSIAKPFRMRHWVQTAKLIILLAAAHFLLATVLFLCFGIGLEGKQHVGHLVFWLLMMPAAYFPLEGFIFIPLNSLLWGFCCALLLKGFSHFFN